MTYTITDHQGSLAAYRSSGTWTRLSYDAWGRRRNAEDGSYGNVPALATDRGYTGHEHLDEFGLINMNGRMYDPMLGRMLSPDIVVQQTDYTQSYNRYSYCFNNPLRFTDPSGYVVRGTTSSFRSLSLSFHESYSDNGAFFNTDDALGQQLPIIEPMGEEEDAAYNAFRKEVFSDEKYSEVQAEIELLESAEEVFRLRMGKNTTSEAGGGNFIYNKETGEFDVNIADYGDFSTMGKLAHEFKHLYQYMKGELAFDISGDGKFGKPIAYDIFDEYDAYKRQSLFDEKTISIDVINNRYRKLNQTRTSIYNIMPNSMNQIIELNNHDYRTKNGKIRFIYHGWQNDIK